MSVLVDTSVWIHFLAGRSTAAELDDLLGREEIVGHDLVFGELLIGDRGGRAGFLAAYERIPRASMLAHAEVVEFVRHRRLHGRGVGWLDVHLLASVLVDRLSLWTADPRLAALAKELGVAHRPALQ